MYVGLISYVRDPVVREAATSSHVRLYVLGAEYAKTLGRLRKVGALSGYVSGTSQISDPAVQGSLRMFEAIIG
jgi:hypothetical protein